jgi:hypothetical protein
MTRAGAGSEWPDLGLLIKAATTGEVSLIPLALTSASSERFPRIEWTESFEVSRKGFRSMNSKNRVPAWLLTLMATAVVGLLIVGGCALDKNGSGPGKLITRIGGHSGQLIEPKRCLLKVAIVSRPFGDATINDVVWRVADEQVIPPAERRAWEVNGLRVGRIVGELPLELEAILKETAPQKRVNPTNFFVDNGEPTLIVVSPTVDEASLLLNRENRIFGKDFRDAGGFFRVIPQQEGANDVSLRLVPEIHHGPMQRTYQALPTASPVGPQEFMINNGQQEETIRELATTVVLAPGQIAVIGCRPEYKRSLGSFMLTQSVAHSDQRLEKLVMIWASRNLQGQGDNDGTSNTTDRPGLFKRLMGPMPSPITTKPGPPVPEIPPLDMSVPPAAASTVSTAASNSTSGSPTQAKTRTAGPPADISSTDKNGQAP